MPLYHPAELCSFVEAEAERIGAKAFVTSRRFNRLREMWCAGRFSTAYSKRVEPCQVDIDLVDEQREYDFHLVTPTARLPFQVTEVLDRDRRRGDEYKIHTTSQLASVLDAGDALSQDDAVARVREEIESKLSKYRTGAQSLHLLLYLNLKAFGVAWSDIRDATSDVVPRFSSVWLLSGDAFTCLYGGTRWQAIEGWFRVESEG